MDLVNNRVLESKMDLVIVRILEFENDLVIVMPRAKQINKTKKFFSRNTPPLISISLKTQSL